MELDKSKPIAFYINRCWRYTCILPESIKKFIRLSPAPCSSPQTCNNCKAPENGTPEKLALFSRHSQKKKSIHQGRRQKETLADQRFFGRSSPYGSDQKKTIILTINFNFMAALDPQPTSKLEIWLNRIVTVALTVWSAIQYLLAHPIK